MQLDEQIISAPNVANLGQVYRVRGGQGLTGPMVVQARRELAWHMRVEGLNMRVGLPVATNMW